MTSDFSNVVVGSVDFGHCTVEVFFPQDAGADFTGTPLSSVMIPLDGAFLSGCDYLRCVFLEKDYVAVLYFVSVSEPMRQWFSV